MITIIIDHFANAHRNIAANSMIGQKNMIGLMQQRTTATPKGAHQNILNDSQQHTFVQNDLVLHCNMLITLLQQQKFATHKKPSRIKSSSTFTKCK